MLLLNTQKIKNRILNITAILCIAVISSCSIDYSAMNLDDAEDETLPNSVLFDFTHTIISKNHPMIELKAKRAEQFDKLSEFRLYGVSFTAFNLQDGSVKSTGFADVATIFTTTENAELSGNIVFTSVKDGMTIKGGYLFWDNTLKTLTSRSDQTITLSTSSGTEIRGEGFYADTSNRMFNFSGKTEGTYVIDDSKKSEKK